MYKKLTGIKFNRAQEVLGENLLLSCIQDLRLNDEVPALTVRRSVIPPHEQCYCALISEADLMYIQSGKHFL